MHAQQAQAWARVAALAGLAAAARLALVIVPGFSLSWFVVFIAGIVYGARIGAAVGGLSRLVTDLVISGLHPTFLMMAPIEAAMGAAFGWLGRKIDLGQFQDQAATWSAGVAAWTGLTVTFVFSVAADTANWLVFRAVAGTDSLAGVVWVTYVLAGLVFNILPAVLNAAVFGAATYPVVRALRLNGLSGRPIRPEVPVPPAPTTHD